MGEERRTCSGLRTPAPRPGGGTPTVARTPHPLTNAAGADCRVWWGSADHASLPPPPRPTPGACRDDRVRPETTTALPHHAREAAYPRKKRGSASALPRHGLAMVGPVHRHSAPSGCVPDACACAARAAVGGRDEALACAILEQQPLSGVVRTGGGPVRAASADCRQSRSSALLLENTDIACLVRPEPMMRTRALRLHPISTVSALQRTGRGKQGRQLVREGSLTQRQQLARWLGLGGSSVEFIDTSRYCGDAAWVASQGIRTVRTSRWRRSALVLCCLAAGLGFNPAGGLEGRDVLFPWTPIVYGTGAAVRSSFFQLSQKNSLYQWFDCHPP